MFFKKKKPKRLYIPTQAKWYDKPKRKSPVGHKLISIGLKTRFSRFFKDFFLYFIALLILGALLSFLLFSNKFSINKIEVARNDLYIDSSAIVKLLSDYQGKSIFAFSKSKAQELIHDAYPEFSTIEIRKLLPDRIKVELKTHDIIANLKAYYTLPQVDDTATFVEEADSVSSDSTTGEKNNTKKQLAPIEQIALLNAIGQALFDRDENPELITIYIEGLSQPIEDREFVIQKENLDYITDSIKYLNNQLQMEVEEVRYLTIANEVHLKTKDGFTLWLITKKPYKDQLDRFSSVYKTYELDKQSLAYADLRVNEKVIYCLAGEECDNNDQ